MTTRSHTIDRELFLILIALLLLAFAARFVGASGNDAKAAFATPATAVASTTIIQRVANPYWAPAHAFSRRLAPVYSDATVAETPTPRE